MRNGIAVAAAVLAVGLAAGTAGAQQPYTNVPVNVNGLLPKTPATTDPLGATFTFFSKVTGDAFTAAKNAMTDTFARLRGNQVAGTKSTTAISPLPPAGAYPAYSSPLIQVMPKYQVYQR